jgi:hypothetical protein
MLWLPDSSALVLLDVDSYPGHLLDLVTIVLGHGSWSNDVFVHVVDAKTGRSSRTAVATGLRNPSIVLAWPDDVLP